jgi:glycine hydroxymethyltransferase
MDEQYKVVDKGGTMRLGARPAVLAEGTKSAAAYGTTQISERHRHRYEFNAKYREQLERAGLVIAGTSPDGSLVEIVEMTDHPWFVAVQFHPEFKSKPTAAHPLFSGLVAAGIHPSPIPHADVVTTTTHKTLRGPRGGMILSRDAELGKKFNSAVFPGLQGGPLMHVIAAKAVAFGEALQPGFKDYSKAVIANAQALAARLVERGCAVVAGGTDTHLALIDLTPKGITGKQADEALERAGITCNKNGVPFDPLPPTQTSGIRVGSPAGTTRGFGIAEFQAIGDMIADVLDGLAANGHDGNAEVEKAVNQRVRALCARFPIYPV